MHIFKNNGQDVDFINYLTRKEDVIRYGKKNLSHQIKRVIKKVNKLVLIDVWRKLVMII